MPGPENVLRRVLVAVQHQPTAGADVGAHRQACGDPLRTATPVGQHPTTVLAGVLCGRDRDHLTPGACCLGLKNGTKRCPAGIADALGEVGAAHQVADLQLFERDHVVLPQQRQRRRVVKATASMSADARAAAGMVVSSLCRLCRLCRLCKLGSPGHCSPVTWRAALCVGSDPALGRPCLQTGAPVCPAARVGGPLHPERGRYPHGACPIQGRRERPLGTAPHVIRRGRARHERRPT
jgi:hypothetical protein